MTGVKDQYKLLKDIGKGVTEGFKKVSEPFVKEAVVLPEVKKLFKGLKSGSKKIIKGDKKWQIEDLIHRQLNL